MRVIQRYILDAFIEVKNEQGLSLRAIASDMGYSHTYVSQVISYKKNPSDNFISSAAGVINRYVSNHFQKNVQQNQVLQSDSSNHPLDIF